MRERRRAFLAAVEHSDKHVHCGLSCQFVVLVHAWPMWAAGPPLVLNHEDIFWHAQVTGLHPISDLMVKAENRIRALLLQPAVEKGFVHPRFADLEERPQPPRRRKATLPDFVTGAEAVLDQGVDPCVQHKARAFVTKFDHFLKGP